MYHSFVCKLIRILFQLNVVYNVCTKLCMFSVLKLQAIKCTQNIQVFSVRVWIQLCFVYKIYKASVLFWISWNYCSTHQNSVYSDYLTTYGDNQLLGYSCKQKGYWKVWTTLFNSLKVAATLNAFSVETIPLKILVSIFFLLPEFWVLKFWWRMSKITILSVICVWGLSEVERWHTFVPGKLKTAKLLWNGISKSAQ